MIGVVIPLKREADEFCSLLSETVEENIKGYTTLKGRIGNHSCVVTVGGHGKVMTASSTQFLIDKHPIDWVVHLGSGGAIASDVRIADFVVGESIVEHDYIERFGRAPFVKPESRSDPELVKRFTQFAVTRGRKLFVGRIISGNEDVVTRARRDELLEEYDGLSVDWESHGCAAVCNRAGVPILVVRAMADYAYERTDKEWHENVGPISRQLSEFVIDFIRTL